MDFTRELMWRVTRRKKSRLVRILAKRASIFSEYYNDYSYDFERNGEKLVLARLTELQMNTVFDVGANVGDWARMARGYFPSATIHCFEISSATFETLRKNLQEELFIKNNIGLSNTTGDVEYKDYGTNSGVNTIIKELTFHDSKVLGQTRKAHLTTGDDYCRMHNIDTIDFLKIDVEGAEHMVLEGLNDMLKAGRVRCVQFEYGYAHGDSKFLMRDFFSFFEDRNYAIGKLWSNGVDFGDFSYRLNDFKSGPNYIAVHNTDAAMIHVLTRRA